ncbi:MAG: Xaa-Pro peptidase family protein [Candidatus Omnitrophica bacterium]|nr:Xaa-Pro peptidase family protein [Candidatus Omnitrophota bacterium]
MSPNTRHPNNRSKLIIATSEEDADLYYATRFLAPDSFLFVQVRGKKYLILNELEIDRARKEARVDKCFSLTQLRAEHLPKKPLTYIELVAAFLKKQRAKNLLVPENFPIKYADSLRQRGFKIEYAPGLFFESRAVKTPAEIKAIAKAIRHTEAAVRLAIDTIRKTTIRKGRLYLRGKCLTSEAIKKLIRMKLMEDGYLANRLIVACGIQGIDPHCEGYGPLRAHQPIVMDVFPQSIKSRYHADLTRTIVRGKASPKIKKMYAAVKEAQGIAFRMIRAGMDGSKIHGAIQRRFLELGFATGMQQGRMQGFFHGTGHGLGLAVHESPRIGSVKQILRTGNVVTVEPGLYYKDAGGVRLEDVVVVTQKGCRHLTHLAKFLEV